MDIEVRVDKSPNAQQMLVEYFGGRSHYDDSARSQQAEEHTCHDRTRIAALKQIGQTAHVTGGDNQPLAAAGWIVTDEPDKAVASGPSEILALNEPGGAHIVITDVIANSADAGAHVLASVRNRCFPSYLSARLSKQSGQGDQVETLWAWPQIKHWLRDRILDGLDGEPTGKGTCRIAFPAPMEGSLVISFDDGLVKVDSDVDGSCGPKVELSLETLLRILRSPHSFDVRFLLTGPWTCSKADFPTLAMIAHSLIRPHPDVVTLFNAQEQISSNQEIEVARFSLNEMSREVVISLFESATPAVIEGYGSMSPAVSMSAYEFCQQFADLEIKTLLATQTIKVGDLPELATRPLNHAIYSRGTAVPEEFAALLPAPFFNSDDLKRPFLWFGVSASDHQPVTPLHRDIRHGLLCHAFGRKRITLYPPHQASYLYPRRSFNLHQACWVDPSAPDLRRFPAFANARGFDIVLGSGDVLVLPAGWFHCVYCSAGVNLSATHFLSHAWEVSHRKGP